MLKQYMKFQKDKTKLMVNTEFMNDITFRVPSLVCADKHSEAGGNTYAYYFEKESNKEGMGASHASELAYVFDNVEETIFSGFVDAEMARKMSHMWASFARTGNPSVDGTEWPKYDSECRKTMVDRDDRAFQVEEDLFSEQREIVSQLLEYANIFNVF